MVSTPLLRITDATFGYLKGRQPVAVFDCSDITIIPGQLTGLIGLNGSGKSTFLRSISGLQAPLKGQVLLQDLDIRLATQEQIARYVAVVLTEKIGGFNLCDRLDTNNA